MRRITRDELIDLLSDHGYWSGDDMTDEHCDCEQWPKKWSGGQPVTTWIDHIAEAADRMYPEDES